MLKKVRTLYKPSEFMKGLEKDSPDFRIPGYHIIKDKRCRGVKNPKEKKLTLEDVVNTINDFKKEINKKVDNGFKRVNARIDKLETRIDRIETRIDRIDTRLDYNNLKKLPKTIPSK